MPLFLYHLRPTGSLRQSGERLPDSRCFVEDKGPLCQLSSKRLDHNWHNWYRTSCFPLQKSLADFQAGNLSVSSLSLYIYIYMYIYIYIYGEREGEREGEGELKRGRKRGVRVNPKPKSGGGEGERASGLGSYVPILKPGTFFTCLR